MVKELKIFLNPANILNIQIDNGWYVKYNSFLMQPAYISLGSSV